MSYKQQSDPASLEQEVLGLLANRKEAGLLRERRPFDPVSADPVVSFSGNDYLALASNPELGRLYRDALPAAGGSTASPLIDGWHSAGRQLEESMKKACGFEECLLFAAGYGMNQGALSALAALDNTFFLVDRLCHASLLDGLPRDRFRRYHHLDYQNLEKHLQKLTYTVDGGSSGQTRPARHIIVVTDTVFSMDGDLVNPDRLARLKEMYGFTLYVDDAHGFLVNSHQGRGLAHDIADLLAITFGKATGAGGAALLCNRTWASFMVNYCRSFIYSTAMSPLLAARVNLSLGYVEKHPQIIDSLHQNCLFFLEELERTGLGHHVPGFAERLALARQGHFGLLSPVFPFLPFGDGGSRAKADITLNNRHITNLMQQAMSAGLRLVAIRSPTVERGKERFRISLRSDHRREDIKRLVAFLTEAVRSSKITEQN